MTDACLTDPQLNAESICAGKSAYGAPIQNLGFVRLSNRHSARAALECLQLWQSASATHIG
jgi:hypothetical protein